MTIRIGLIGCGGITDPHIRGYLKLSDAQIAAVSDVVRENAERRAQQAGGAEIFSDYRDMLNTDIDAVDICLPHHLHKDAIVAAAQAKKAILCEKPLCLTVAEANEVQQAVQEHGVMLMCAHNQLFLPAVAHAKEMIESGVFGNVYEVRTTDSFYHTFTLESMGWRRHRSMSGGGELIDTGYHPSYLLLYLAQSTPLEVTSLISNHRLHFMEGEDSAQVLVRFANGSVGNIVTSWAYEPTSNTEKFSFVAEKGYGYSVGNKFCYKIRGQEEVTLELPGLDTFEAEIAAFIACIRNGQRPLHNETDGINVLKMILGAYQSSEQKRTITLSEMP